MMQKRILCFTVFLVLVMLCPVGCGRDLERHYASLADAGKDEIAQRGWIPDFLPASSRSIYIAGDLSPSREWCAFEFTANDSDKLRQRIRKIDSIPPYINHIPRPGVSWWPAVLKGDLDVIKIRQSGFDVYIFDEPGTSVTTSVYLIAIDWAKSRGFFYYHERGNT
jgi:hypothetical protein